MSRLLKAVLAAVVLTATTAGADTWVVDKDHTNVNFQVRHHMSKVNGRFTNFLGTVEADPARPEASSVEFTIKAISIDTSVAKKVTSTCVRQTSWTRSSILSSRSRAPR